MDINNILYDDVLNLIIKNTNNNYCVIVCKKWHNLVMTCSTICNLCNKFVKIYDNTLWKSYNDDKLCHEWNININKYDLLETITRNWRSFEKFDNNSEKLCLNVVKTNGFCLKYIKFQSENICLESVKNNGYALLFVRNQTDNICLEAVKKYGYALQYVHNQTENICLNAVMNKGCALQFVRDQTDKICLAAVTNSGSALQYVHNQTEEICLAAATNNGISLQFCKIQTENICIEAVKNNRRALKYIVDLKFKQICRKIRTDKQPKYIQEHTYDKYYHGYKPKKIKL